MGIQSAEELLEMLKSPEQIDALADQLADAFPAPNLDDPNAPLAPGLEGGQQQVTPQGTGASAPVQQATAQANPSVDFANSLLGREQGGIRNA